MEKPLQHQTTTQCIGLPPTRAQSHRIDGPTANHALTFNLDHPSAAAQVQGAGKSSAARILAGVEYFSDNLPTMGTKDASDHVRGKWIIEVGELSVMQKSEIESTKAFISRQEERFRPAYKRKEITYKRRFVFIGKTNQGSYLRDKTGNRRFWSVRVGTIDLVALKHDRDQLWAKAIYRYRNGEKWYLTEEEGKLAAEVQQDRVSEDIWQEKLSIKLEDITEVSIAEAAEKKFRN